MEVLITGNVSSKKQLRFKTFFRSKAAAVSISSEGVFMESLLEQRQQNELEGKEDVAVTSEMAFVDD